MRLILVILLFSCGVSAVQAVTIVTNDGSKNLGAGLVNDTWTLFSRVSGAHVETGRLFRIGWDREEKYFTQRIAEVPENARRHFDYAGFLYYEDRHDEYEAQLQKVLELDPEHIDARVALAVVLIKRGEIENAFKLVDPDNIENAENYIGLANFIYWRSGNYVFEELYEKAYELEPDNIVAIARYLDVVKSKDQRTLELFEQMIENGLTPENDFYKNALKFISFGFAEEQYGDLLRRHSQLFPNSRFLNFYHADFLRKIGQHQQSDKILQQAYATYSEQELLDRAPLQFFREANMVEFFIRDILQNPEANSNLPLIKEVGGLINIHENLDEADQIFQLFLEKYPDNPSLLAEYGYHFDLVENRHQADNYYFMAKQTWSRIEMDYYPGKWPKGSYYLDPTYKESKAQDHIYKRLREVQEMGVTFNDDDFLDGVRRGVNPKSYSRYATLEHGEYLFKQEIAANPGDAQLINKFSGYYLYHSDYSSARSTILDAIDEFPDNPEMYINYINFITRSGGFYSVGTIHHTFTKSALEKFPDNKTLNMLYGHIVENISIIKPEDQDDVEKTLLQSLNHFPEMYQLRIALLHLYRITGQFDKMQREYEYAFENDLVFADEKVDLLIHYFITGQHARLIEYSRLLFNAPEDIDDEEVIGQIGFLLATIGENKEVEKFLDELEKLFPESGYPRASIGIYKLQQGYSGEAYLNFKNAVSIEDGLDYYYDFRMFRSVENFPRELIDMINRVDGIIYDINRLNKMSG